MYDASMYYVTAGGGKGCAESLLATPATAAVLKSGSSPRTGRFRQLDGERHFGSSPICSDRR